MTSTPLNTRLLIEHDIAHGDTCVYFHIGKTGGTTFASHIDPMWLPEARFPGYLDSDLDRVPLAARKLYRSFIGHFFYSYIRSLGIVPSVEVTLLRDPIKRFISHYAHLRRPGYDAYIPEWAFEIRHAQQMPLASFMLSGMIYLQMCNLQTQMLGGLMPFWGLSHLGYQIHRQDPLPMVDVLPIAKRRLASFACFGLAERMQDSLFMLSYIFGWRPLMNDKQLNPSHEPLDDISPELRDRIAAVNAQDMGLYAYAKELFEARMTEMTNRLLERYGDTKHARLTLPLPEEVMLELLERHYRERYAARHGTAPSTAET
jgi:hypothetical protein